MGPPDPPNTDTTRFGAGKPHVRVTRLYTVAGSVRSESRRNCGHTGGRDMGKGTPTEKGTETQRTEIQTEKNEGNSNPGGKDRDPERRQQT